MIFPYRWAAFLLKVTDMINPDEHGTYSDAETAARAEAALKRMLATPPKPHKDSKLGKKRESGN